jgi:UDP-N-acetylglucosamine acyltransferase
VNRGTKSKGKTVVGSDCLLQSYVHIAHDCNIGNHCILSGYVGLGGEVIIEDWAILGGGSLVHQFVRIGMHVMVQGGCKVIKDVPPYIMAGRDPVVYAGLNLVFERRGFGTERSGNCEMYRTIYMNRTIPMPSEYRASFPNHGRDHIITFVRTLKGVLSRIARRFRLVNATHSIPGPQALSCPGGDHKDLPIINHMTDD